MFNLNSDNQFLIFLNFIINIVINFKYKIIRKTSKENVIANNFKKRHNCEKLQEKTQLRKISKKNHIYERFFTMFKFFACLNLFTMFKSFVYLNFSHV